MAYYPIFVELAGKKVVVVGGGMIAERKIETLLEHGADVYLISRELTPTLQCYAKEKRVRLIGQDF